MVFWIYKVIWVRQHRFSKTTTITSNSWIITSLCKSKDSISTLERLQIKISNINFDLYVMYIRVVSNMLNTFVLELCYRMATIERNYQLSLRISTFSTERKKEKKKGREAEKIWMEKIFHCRIVNILQITSQFKTQQKGTKCRIVLIKTQMAELFFSTNSPQQHSTKTLCMSWQNESCMVHWKLHNTLHG